MNLHMLYSTGQAGHGRVGFLGEDDGSERTVAIYINYLSVASMKKNFKSFKTININFLLGIYIKQYFLSGAESLLFFRSREALSMPICVVCVPTIIHHCKLVNLKN